MERFARLIQVQAAIRMLQFRLRTHSETHSLAPYTHLQRAQALLFNIIHTQMNGAYPTSSVRLGSTYTWRNVRLQQANHVASHDPNEDLFAPFGSAVDPATEMFPEDEVFVFDSCVIDAELRESRHELLRRIKQIIYLAMDENKSVQHTILQVWQFWMSSMTDNVFLRRRHGGEAIANQWNNTNDQDCAAFLLRFHFDGEATSSWLQNTEHLIVEDPAERQTEEYASSLMKPDYPASLAANGALGSENALFNHAYQTHMPTIITLARYVGFKEQCGPLTWFSIIQDWDQLGSDNHECHVCFTAYDIPFEAGMSSLKAHLWSLGDPIPVQLACKHVLCMACLKTWAESHAENKDKCPMCRTYLPPPNPQSELVDGFDVKGMLALASNMTIHPQDYATAVLQVIDTYVSKLPSLLLEHEGVGFSDRSINLTHWSTAVSSPVDELTSVHASDQDLRSWFHSYKAAWSFTALQDFIVSRDRLEAYLKGDLVRFRQVCKRQLYVRSYYQLIGFTADLLKWTREYRQHTRLA
jgi:hypothetical protein